jgi:hypothetical protein
MWQGTGPFGMPGLDGVQAFVRQLQAQAARVWPQVRGAADARDLQSLTSNTIQKSFRAGFLLIVIEEVVTWGGC